MLVKICNFCRQLIFLLVDLMSDLGTQNLAMILRIVLSIDTKLKGYHLIYLIVDMIISLPAGLASC